MTETTSATGARAAIEATIAEAARLLEQAREQLAALPEQAPPPEPEHDLLTMEETARKLRLSVSMIKKLTAAGELRTERFGRRVLIPAEEIQRYRYTARDTGRDRAA